MLLPGYTLWIAATSDGAVYTCNHQDDGYGGTLKNKRKWNEANELGRSSNPIVPGRVRGDGGEPGVREWGCPMCGAPH